MAGYWNRKLARRRFIVGTGLLGAGTAAAALVGCGGGGDGESGPPSNLTPRQDTSDKATKGGIFQTHTLIEPTSLDAIGGNSTSGSAAAWAYERLVQFQVGRLKRPAPLIVGAVAESFELSGDAMQVTFRLRPTAKFDARAPTSSRPVDAEDVVWSWNRYSTLAAGRANLVNAPEAPNAPVESVRAVDSKTVVAKLAFPSGEVLDLFAAVGPYMMPREFEDRNKADSRNTMLGTGAWTLTKFEASVGLQYRRNPNWWRTDRPFVEGFDLAILKERAQEIAQFRAANTWWSGIPPELQLETKRDLPELQMIEGSDLSFSSPHIKFSWRPDSPFKDERVRRAVSLAIDRDLYADTFTDSSSFAAAGFPQETFWASHLGPGYGDLWLDPKTDKGKALGEGGRYFQHDPAEAKKLLDAAGHSAGLKADSSFNAGTNYGQNYHKEIEAITGMLDDVGFQISRQPREYQNEWLPKFFYGRGDFDGISWVPGGGRSAIGQFLQTFYHSSGQGNIPPGVDPQLDALVEKQARELDKGKRTETIHEIQRYLAKGMRLVPYSYAVPGFALAWPWVGNFGTFVAWPGSEVQQNVYINTWIDQTKLPARFKTS